MKKHQRSHLRRHLKKSATVIVKTEPLTDENFRVFAKLYRSTVPLKKGGLEIFYIPLYEQKGIPPGLQGIFFYHPTTYDLIGASIINTWGAFQDTGKEPRKYCAGQVGAFAKEGREFHIGYRDFMIEMNLANARGDKVYSARADLDIWGADIGLGLMENKTVTGFYPFPDSPFEYVKVLNMQEILEKSGESGYAFFSLNMESEFCQERYLKDLEKSKARCTTPA